MTARDSESGGTGEVVTHAFRAGGVTARAPHVRSALDVCQSFDLELDT